MEELAKSKAHIKGWGIDADPKNDPTYPMRKRSNETHEGYSWDRPTLQPKDMEVLHSIERPNITAVFGTSNPPGGLSGIIRRLAFKDSENSYLHWLPLLVADRVDVVEGILDDLVHGKVPNIFAEKGYKASWKHNPVGLATKLAVVAAVTTTLVVLATRKDKDDK